MVSYELSLELFIIWRKKSWEWLLFKTRLKSSAQVYSADLILSYQVYLLTAVPLFSVPQLSSSPALNHLVVLSLPHLLPVAHIGMVSLKLYVPISHLRFLQFRQLDIELNALFKRA